MVADSVDYRAQFLPAAESRGLTFLRTCMQIYAGSGIKISAIGDRLKDNKTLLGR
jgi:hypothetical protein